MDSLDKETDHMSSVLDFIFRQKENQKEILLYFHDLFVTELKLNSKIRYKIPFYDGLSRICYMNPKRSGVVELAFIRGRELSNEHDLLDTKERREIAGIEIESLSKLPFETIHKIIMEAIALDRKNAKKGS